MDTSQIQAAFDDVVDQAVLFHGFADYMRDYDVFIHATADPCTGIRPEHLQYRFKHCVRATATTAVSPEIWKQSLDERLIDYERGRELDGYVWGVKWQVLYPGMKLVPGSADATQWSRELGGLFSGTACFAKFISVPARLRERWPVSRKDLVTTPYPIETSHRHVSYHGVWP